MKFLPSLRSNIGINYSVLLCKIVIIGTIFMFVGAAQAAAPLAGTCIGNQASASYVDQANVTRNVTSNLVTTIV